MRVLVINAGSSSVKYSLIETRNAKELVSGMVERIGLPGTRHRHGAHSEEVEVEDYDDALRVILSAQPRLREAEAVGHRVVHGGEDFRDTVLITPEVKETVKRLFDLAPLHNPPNLACIEACERALPELHQAAVFDTAFHSTLPPHAYTYPIPHELCERDGIRRYGFHGTSHRYVSARAAEMLGRSRDPDLKLVTAHLGNGCSLAAVRGGKSVETSMGFTPLEGVMMGTRSGSIDPAVVLYLIEKKGMSADEVDRLLNKESGILGLSGTGSPDMRDLLAAAHGGDGGDARARLALEVYCYRISMCVGAFAASLDGLDALVFTAGVGENSPEVREKVCARLTHLGIALDPEKNARGAVRQASLDPESRDEGHGALPSTSSGPELAEGSQPKGGEGDISRDGARSRVLVVPTNKELMIARETETAAKAAGKS